jgi:hypothetical protein
MKFEDDEVKNLDCTNVGDIILLIVKYLCGEKHYEQLLEDDKGLIEELTCIAKKRNLNYEQFNELLLLLNQNRVKKDFFKFIFEKDEISLEDLRQGVIKFRGFAMLCFANFRFAYKQFIDKRESELEGRLRPCYKEESKFTEELETRPIEMLKIDGIERGKTWYLGEISGAKVTKEAEILDKEIEKAEEGKIKFGIKELNEFGKRLVEISRETKESQEKAIKNTDIYITRDYMDVYIATSMRNKWEFEETFDFIKEVFGKPCLKKLNLRYFDPTQSKCKNSRDKGLIEGLMLKRALCTIYMAQESDTMGKDSELAATLAQSKPVIAYVPKYNSEEYSKKIENYPLNYFKKRLLVLKAEEIFNDKNFIEKLPLKLSTFNKHKKIFKFEDVINNFLSKLDEYRHNQPFSLWAEKETEFKEECRDFSRVCEILAVAECYNFDRRADLLKGKHPLSMQVDLQSGVANGVLVVRNAEDCAELLYRILTNSMEFRIKHPIIFNLSEETKEKLYKLSEVFKNNFYFDAKNQTLNLVKDLGNEEINKLGRLAESEGCPESLKIFLKKFSFEGATILEEKISGSAYRVVTDSEKLTNSFWDLFI